MAWISPQVRSFNNQSVPQSTADTVAPSTGGAFWSQAGDTMRTISDFEQRAVDSNWLAPIGYYGQPSKEISPEEANTLAGRHIADKPIPQSVALDLANHEQDKAQREDVWNRYTSQHNALTNFGVGAAAFVADPVNFAAGFIPGPGEELILGKLGYSATKTAPWLAKFGARATSGAIGGAAVGAPVSAAKYAASLDTQDYSMRQALLDTAAFAAYGALFHTGIHTAGDMFFKKSKAREDAMKSAVAQILKGEPVNIEPVMNQFGIKSPNYEDLVGGPIAQDVSKKLSLAGRPQEEADAAGAIHQSIFNTASARFEGRLGTPEEMYKKYGSDIASGETRKLTPDELNQMAYHGSGADFNEFSDDFIGSGEGAQMYGVGHYLANKRDIADFYRKQAGDKDNTGKGYLYTAELTPKDEEWLDTEKSMSKQSSLVQERLKMSGLWNGEDLTVRQFQADIAKKLFMGDVHQARALTSEALKNAGIPGLRYSGLTHKLEVAKAENDLPVFEQQLEHAEMGLEIANRTGHPRALLREEQVQKLRTKVQELKSLISSPEASNYVVFDPKNINILNKEYYQDAKPTFYSALSKGVEGIKNEKAPADQWLQTIRNLKGVKKEEVDWSGVEDWLKEQKSSVTKADLQKFLEENAVNVQEVQRENAVPMTAQPLNIQRDELARQWFNRTYDESPARSQVEIDRALEEGFFSHDDYLPGQSGNNLAPKYPQYVLPGGKDYRELLLTLPKEIKSKVLNPEEIAEYQRLQKKIDNETATIEEQSRYDQLVNKDLDNQRFEDEQAQRPEFRTGHWDESNVLAHIRFDTRTGANGEKILHMAEIQSDWHQKGRREGYAPDKEIFDKIKAEYKEKYHALAGRQKINELFNKIGNLGFDTVGEAKRAFADDPFSWDLTGLSDSEIDEVHKFANATRAYRQALKEAESQIPNAPFKQSWHELALKRMLRYAAEHDYDKLSWDTGEVTADRFDLSHQVSRIKYDGLTLHVWNNNGERILNQQIAPEKLDDYIGKEAADKLKDKINNHETYYNDKTNSNFATLEGLDLKIGGEGMKGFYDKILVDFMKRYTKKWGGKVEDTYLTVDEKLKKAFETQINLDGRTAAEQESLLNESKTLGKSVHSVTVTSEMKKSVLEGQPLFQARKGSFTMFPDGTKLIKMFQTGDASTIIHETSHQLLENMREWANHPEAPESLREDWATVKDWLGIDENAGITRTQHEKFARAGERYLKSGDAPSSALKRVFDAFKQWLTQIYRSVAGMQVPLKPEIKDVFDRLLATDQEILDKDKVVSDYAQERQGIADTGVAGGISQGRLTQAIKEIYPETETPEKRLDETSKEIEAKLQGVYLEDHLDENQQKQLLELNQLLENPVEYDQKMVEGLKRNRLDLLRSALLSKKIHDIVELNGGIKNAHTVLHSMLVGSHAPVKDLDGADISRLGSENLGRAQTGKLISTLYSQLNKKGLLNVAKSGHLEKEVVEALAQLSDPNYKPSIPVSQPAKELAALYRGPINFITRKLNEEGGAQIGTALDYVAHTEYSRQKIRRMAGYFKSPIQAFDAYWEFFSQHLDHEKTFEGLTPVAGQSIEQAKYSMMRGAYDGILTGVHKKFNSIFGLKPGQYIPPQFEGTKNLARTMSKGRIFVLKNPQSFLAVMQRLGNSPSLLDNIVNHLERASKEWGLMKNWGTNPQGKLNWMIDSIERKYRDIDPDGVRKFRNKVDTLRTTMKYLDGTNNTPKNERAAELARWGSTVRTLESSFMLGGVGVTHGAGAMITVPAELEHHGVMQIESLGKTAQAILSTKGMLEKEETAGGLTAFSEAGLRNLKSRFDIENVEDFPGGVSAYANAYMKLTALPAILNRVQAQIEYVLSERLGRHIDKPWEDIIQSNRVLPKYGITEADWKLLQSAKDSFDTDGSLRYLTANVVDKIPDEDIAKLLKESGSYKPMSKEIERYRWELSDKLITYFNDAAVHGIVTPGAYEKALAFGDNPRGSLNGEIRRFIMQFKMWPFALVYQNLMRTYMLKTSVAQFATSIGMTLGLTYIFGYARMAINDELLGRQPRNPTDYRTILAALAQGGGLGIFGDYLFGQFNRFETNPWESTLGPVITDAGQLGMIYQHWTQDMSKDDSDPVKATDKAGVDLLRWGTRHIPFANLIYIKGAMDYMLMYHLYEAMSPGWWERTNRRMEKEQGRHMVGYHPYQGVPYGVPGVTLTQ